MTNPQALETFGRYDKKSLTAGIVVGQGLKGRARAPQTSAPAGFPQELWDNAVQRTNAMIAFMQNAQSAKPEQNTPDDWRFDKDAFCFGIAAGRSLEGWEIDGVVGGVIDGWAMARYYIHINEPDTIKFDFATYSNFTGMENYSGLDLEVSGFIDFGDGNIQTLSKRELNNHWLLREHNYESGDYIFTIFVYRPLAIADYSDSQTREYADDPQKWQREHVFSEGDGHNYAFGCKGFLDESVHEGTLRAVYLDGGVDVASSSYRYAFQLCNHLEYLYFPSWNSSLAAINLNSVSFYVGYTLKQLEKFVSYFKFELTVSDQCENPQFEVFNRTRKFYREISRGHSHQKEIHYNISFSLWVQKILTLWYDADFGCKFSATLFFSDKILNLYSLNGVLVLPDGIEYIGGKIFSCTSITSVIIPTTVTTIDESAFSYTNLYSVVIPNGVETIRETAFYACYYMNDISISDSVTSMGKSVFELCGDIHRVRLSRNLEVIPQRAFCTCRGSVDIVIPDSVKTISSQAFMDFEGLNSVTFGNGLTDIGNSAFRRCTSLTLTNTEMPSLTTIGVGAFQDCTSLILANTEMPSLTMISANAFQDCTSLTLTNTEMPSLTHIGNSAFQNCTSLTHLTNAKIPDSVTEIGSCAFKGCTNLVSVAIPNHLTKLSNEVFYGCSSLPSVVIPESVTSIGQGAFAYCSSLRSITIPQNVSEVGGNQYTSISSYGSGAFAYCTNLTTATILGSEIGSCMFQGCTSLTNVTISDNVTYIDGSAFYGCASLSSIVIPESIVTSDYTIISDRICYGCSSLTSVTIPDGVVGIGMLAFANCTSLTSVFIPASVTSIYNYVFRGCSNLTDVYYGGTEAQWNAIRFYSSELFNRTIHYNSTGPDDD